MRQSQQRRQPPTAHRRERDQETVDDKNESGGHQTKPRENEKRKSVAFCKSLAYATLASSVRFGRTACSQPQDDCRQVMAVKQLKGISHTLERRQLQKQRLFPLNRVDARFAIRILA
jgi:hypothetical protein